MADDKDRPRSSRDRVSDAWKWVGSDDSNAGGPDEPESESDGAGDFDVGEYLRSVELAAGQTRADEGSAGGFEGESEAEPLARTVPIHYDASPPPGGGTEVPGQPVAKGSRLKGAGIRRLVWVAAVAIFVFARGGFAADLLGDPTGEQVLDSLEAEMTAGGISDEAWSCIESGLRSGGYVDVLNDASVSEIEEALESRSASPPPELISFREGFDMYANPARSTSCLTAEEASALAVSVGAAAGDGPAALQRVVPGVDLPEGVAGLVVGVVTLDADVDGAVLMAPGAVLDCDGHAIRGNSSLVGVAMADDSTVRNCFVSGFNTGVGLSGTNGAVVENVEVTDSRIGFYLVNGTTNATITASNSTGNEIGFLFEPSVSSVRLEGNAAVRNWRSGFMMGYTHDSFLIGNTTTGGGSGFWITNSNRNQFVDNTVTGATEWFSIGVFDSSSDNLFEGNEVSGGGVAIAVNSRASNNEFVENFLHHNTKGAHVEAGAGSGNVFDGNRVTANSHVGLWDDTPSAATRYTSNDCSLNTDADSVPDGLC